MKLKLNIWQKPGTTDKFVYVEGLTPDDKVWLQSYQGKTVLRCKSGRFSMPPEDIMNLVAQSAQCDPHNWSEFLSAVQGAPRAGRGRQPGTMASSRREGSYGSDRPEAWTGEDADADDPNLWKDPIPEPTTLIVDDREPSKIVDRLRKVDNLTVEITSLETGDYVIPGKFVIERKTTADFAASILGDTKRMFYQTDRVASSGLRGILIIEGDIYKQTNMSLNSISGTLSYLTAIQGISIIPTLSLGHTAGMLAKLCRHSNFGLGYDPALRSIGPKDPASAASFVLEGIPGVSSKIARALLARFGSVAGVAQATRQEIMSVKGIGDSRVDRIWATLHSDVR